MSSSYEIGFGFRNWFCINVAIKIKDITNIHVTWRLEALHQGDQQYIPMPEI